MTDDIVAILRGYADRFDDDDIPHELGMWVRNAADEIERSWIEWSLWKMTAEQLARELGKVSYAETTYEDTKKAWNG